MLYALTLAVTVFGCLVSFAAILAQFIGAELNTLNQLSIIQLGCLALATVLAGVVFAHFLSHRQRNSSLFRQFFIDMPGWLMFTLLLIVITALLGDLAVILVRNITQQQVSGVFHLPSLCIIVYAVIFRVVHLDANLKS